MYIKRKYFMKLEDYLCQHNVCKASLIRSAGLNWPLFMRIMNGKGDMKMSHAFGLERATDGLVTARELYERYLNKSHKAEQPKHSSDRNEKDIEKCSRDIA